MKQWEGTDFNKEDVTEEEISWELFKSHAAHLRLDNDGQMISLPAEMEYVQGKSASANLGSSKITVLSRYIGFKIGNNIVKVRVDEQTNNISIEVENDPNHISDTR